ncbi:hypothetical protein BH23THE1_BH23THE1_34910 [soil metagenome]
MDLDLHIDYISVEEVVRLFSDEVPKPPKPPKPRKPRGTSRAVCEIDSEGQIINRWESITSACESIGVKFKGFYNACNKNELIKNRLFRYDDDLIDPNEYWKFVPYYQIKHHYASNYGRIQNYRGRILKPIKKNNRLYVKIRYKYRKIGTEQPLNRIIAAAFLGPNNAKIVHLDGDTSNCRPENLKYMD